MSYTDRTLVCRDCGQQFTFTAGEQEFYMSRGLLNAPSRCASCRAVRKSQRGEGGSSSPDSGYSTGGSRWGEGGGGSSSGGYSRREPREMFTVTCSNCGQEAQVPFQPTEGKPVYCSDCYRQMGGRSAGGSSRSYGSRY